MGAALALALISGGCKPRETGEVNSVGVRKTNDFQPLVKTNVDVAGSVTNQGLKDAKTIPVPPPTQKVRDDFIAGTNPIPRRP